MYNYTVRNMELPTQKYSIKCPYILDPIGVCIHNTYNNASANNEVTYMQNNNNEVSFHIAIDEKEVVKGLPLNRNAWSSGDGNGNGNRKYIHIEICRSTDYKTNNFSIAESNTVDFVARLLKEKGWTIDNIKAHKDFANKNCPHRTDMNCFKQAVMIRYQELFSKKKCPTCGHEIN